MKVAYLSIGLLALFSPLTAAWSKEDREIFRIRDEIAAHETDASATFYDILGVTKSASHDEITKAYRLKTRSLHPDKVKQQLKKQGNKSKAPTKSEINAAVKSASDRQARLSLIANILRGPLRDRYDHFLSNGFPLWKGTDYYYNRYRPGLGTAVLGAFLMGGGAVHYLILYMGFKRQKEFIERYIRFAREAAWGNSMSAGIPGVDTPPAAPAPAPAAEEDEEGGPQQPMNRKQRRMQERETKKEEGRGAGGKKARKAKSASTSRDVSAAPTGARKRVVAENGKILVVDSVGGVYLEEEDEEGNVQEYLLDPNELSAPTIKDTAIVRLPLWAVRSTIGRLLPGSGSGAVEASIGQEDEDSDAPQDTPSTDSAGEDFELLEKSTDSLRARATGTGPQQGGKAKKRRGRK